MRKIAIKVSVPSYTVNKLKELEEKLGESWGTLCCWGVNAIHDKYVKQGKKPEEPLACLDCHRPAGKGAWHYYRLALCDACYQKRKRKKKAENESIKHTV